ncbi:putative ABC transporter [Lyophyllum shimeji]|uniref:ABC transporter n=1 Tax=Lyophyllum shimeji TaxID=47721 RepID=A0A9P3PQN4_LYOSH|nr:putative ABC transporter [Lyophyllum shimeji]
MSGEKVPNVSAGLEIPASIQARKIGIWTVLTRKDYFAMKPSRCVEWNKYISTLPHVRSLVAAVFGLNPPLVILFLAVRAWKAVEPVINVYIASRLFIALEAYLREGHGNLAPVLQAIVAHLVCVLARALTSSLQTSAIPKLTKQTEMYFQEHLMRENLRYDVQTLQQCKTQMPSAYMGWHCFEEICEACSNILSLFTIVTSILYQQHGGWFFTTLCLIYPIAAAAVKSHWTQPMVYFTENKNFIRLQSLQRLVAAEYRQDIVVNNLTEHLLDEYAKARKALGTHFTESPFSDLRCAEDKPYFHVLRALSGEMPLMYFAYSAVLNPASITMSALAILQQQSSVLTSSIEAVFEMFEGAMHTLDTVKALYHVEELKLVDGSTEYRPPEGDKGMSFELRNVSFAYPGTKAKDGAALKDISLHIKPGQLVVVVGENGSGKSTLIKLLTRVYDVTSGVLLVNNLPIKEYKLAGLRDATAVLNQELNIFPLSLAENVGLGYSACVGKSGMIREAVWRGGAGEVVEGLREGLDTVLQPVVTAEGYNLDDGDNEELKDILESLEVTTSVSGGEKQRLVASRTFMRLQSPGINFVAVDEPSSALDPRGELDLFNRLRSEQAGRTMIFVTHRFGHLTKHADLIICMKNGRMVESGTHQDLLALGGEYATLYNIQAQAFASAPLGTDAATGSSTP